MTELKGFKHVAVIEIESKYTSGDYYYALYDENIKKDDWVLVTGTAHGKLLKIKEVMTTEEADKHTSNIDITAEIIGRVDTENYNKRLENRVIANQIRRQLLEKRNEIEARKDDLYYAEIDKDYADLLKKLDELYV